MAFDIQTFKSNFKDGLRTHSYEVVVTPPTMNSQLLRLRSEIATIPGAAFMSVDNYKPYGSGISYTIPHSHNFQEIAFTHVIDKDASILEGFNAWANKIVNIDSTKKFMAKYHDEYTVDMAVFLYDVNGNRAKDYYLREVYPLSIDPISLSWGNNDELMKINVSYRFSYYVVSN